MEDLFCIHPGILQSAGHGGGGEATPAMGSLTSEASEVLTGSSAAGSDLTDMLKAQIASHPRYPALLSAYLDCRKVGAPPEVATLLEDIESERRSSAISTGEIGADPELDEFMESYCLVLLCYKENLSNPFEEVSSFLNHIGAQLATLCPSSSIPAAAMNMALPPGVSEDDLSCRGLETSEGKECDPSLAGHDLKEMLQKKYSGYLSNLRKEFLKKRKKGKLPKDARMVLLDWWNTHYRWPYPTEEDKVKLAKKTGLEQKQINNWFINQRKRHWKPSDDMRFALIEGVNSASSETMLCFDKGSIGSETK